MGAFGETRKVEKQKGEEKEGGAGGDTGRTVRAETQLGCRIKWERNEEKLAFPLCNDGGEAALSASNFHTSISAQLRSTLPNQSSRKYP